MVGPMILDHVILVRVQAPEPRKDLLKQVHAASPRSQSGHSWNLVLASPVIAEGNFTGQEKITKWSLAFAYADERGDWETKVSKYWSQQTERARYSEFYVAI